MTQWTQCSFIQTTPTWADAACNIRPDTHDGDTDGRKRIHEVPGFDEPRHETGKRAKKRLRALLEKALDPDTPSGTVTAEMREIAAPIAKRLESGRLEIDWQAIARSVELQQRILAFREAFAREQAEIAEDDDEVTLLTWN